MKFSTLAVRIGTIPCLGRFWTLLLPILSGYPFPSWSCFFICTCWWVLNWILKESLLCIPSILSECSSPLSILWTLAALASPDFQICVLSSGRQPGWVFPPIPVAWKIYPGSKLRQWIICSVCLFGIFHGSLSFTAWYPIFWDSLFSHIFCQFLAVSHWIIFS